VALTVVASATLEFSVLGDGVTTVLPVDISAEPFRVSSPIKRVTALLVSGVTDLTATRTFSGSTVTITFSAPFAGIANVSLTVLL
jgi:hypothetical protein